MYWQWVVYWLNSWFQRNYLSFFLCRFTKQCIWCDCWRWSSWSSLSVLKCLCCLCHLYCWVWRWSSLFQSTIQCFIYWHQCYQCDNSTQWITSTWHSPLLCGVYHGNTNARHFLVKYVSPMCFVVSALIIGEWLGLYNLKYCQPLCYHNGELYADMHTNNSCYLKLGTLIMPWLSFGPTIAT